MTHFFTMYYDVKSEEQEIVVKLIVIHNNYLFSCNLMTCV